MKLHDLRLRTRIALAFGGAILTTLVLVAVVQLRLTQSAANAEAMSRSVHSQARASSLHLEAKENAIAILVTLVSPSAEQQARLAQEIKARDARIVQGLAELEAGLAGAPDELALLAEARKRHTTHAAGVQRILALVQAGKTAEANFAADEEMIPMMAPFLAALDKLDKSQLIKVDAVKNANADMVQGTRRITLLAGAAAIAAALLAGFWLARSLTGPLGEAMRLANDVAAGNLSDRVHAVGDNEVAQLLRALNHMSENLSALVAQVRTAADGIATGSSQIASGSADLAQRTEQQVNHLQHAAAAVEAMSSTLRQNAENATQANALALGASTVAAKGGEVVGQVVATMRDINQSSRKIADIIAVIDSISFQTNILALNAAVEAARAGEQGRGFAVVAGEVRGLAQRSAEAAREIRQLIQASVERVEQGTGLVDQAGQTMQEVVAAIQRVSALIGEVSHATQAQSAGMASVGQTVTQMDQTTLQNSALVHESSSAAQNLSQRATQLVESVAVFKLSA